MRILDIPIDRVSGAEATKIFRRLMDEEGCSLIVTPNSEIVVNASKDSQLKTLIEGADLVIPDGIGLVYASKIMKNPLQERVTGIDFLTQVLVYLQETGKSIYLLGSKPGVAEKAAENMRMRYPALKIAGTHDGYFQAEDEPALIEEINASGASFLCTALGSPKQEKFIMKYREQLKHVRAGMGVGGSLDVWAGTVKRAPAFYQKHGLEWLYRLIQQPSRAGRMAKLPVFMIKVLTFKK